MVSDTNQCFVTGSTVVISTPDMPTAPIAGSDSTYCEDDSVADLTAIGTNIEWFSDPGLTNLIGTGSPFTPTVVVGGNTFYVTQTDSGCQSPASSVVITVNPKPAKPSITVNGNILSTDPGFSYQWFFEGDTIPGATAQTYKATQSGVYSVSITDINGCSAMSDPVEVSGIGINEVDAGIGIDLYPNPNEGKFTLEIKTRAIQDMELMITNVIGQEVFFEKLSNVGGTFGKEIDLTGYPSGIYQLRLSIGNDHLNKRIVIGY